MADETLILYYTMTERLSEHCRARGGAYPEKFVLNPLQYSEYLRCVTHLSQAREKAVDSTSHMGVPIEVDDDSPGVMVATDGCEVLLR